MCIYIVTVFGIKPNKPKTVSIQTKPNQNRYSFIMEWVFGCPIGFGFDLYKTPVWCWFGFIRIRFKYSNTLETG